MTLLHYGCKLQLRRGRGWPGVGKFDLGRACIWFGASRRAGFRHREQEGRKRHRRNGRNGQLFTSAGKLNLKNAPYREDFGPVDPECDCDLCSRYSRAYLHHLFRAGELSALRLASLHNVAFLIKLMRKIRQSIIDGTFLLQKKQFLETYRNHGE